MFARLRRLSRLPIGLGSILLLMAIIPAAERRDEVGEMAAVRFLASAGKPGRDGERLKQQVSRFLDQVRAA